MKILLFNPSGALRVYSKSKIKVAVPIMPSLSLAAVAGALLDNGHDVRIIDLIFSDAGSSDECVKSEINLYKPDMVGVTATTTLFHEASRISDLAKSISNNIITILGGPHASCLPIEALNASSFDIAVTGEGENAVKAIASRSSGEAFTGVYFKAKIGSYRADSKIQRTPEIPVDSLPMPALKLFDASKYFCPRVIARRNPVGPIEMSRGCIFNCSFCNKTVHGRNFRIKSPERVIAELRELKRLGYREFHVLDDQFTTDINKAKAIVDEILKQSINMTWNLRTGIRVDKVDEEFLRMAKKAGCYQVGIGFESGNQKCLDAAGKGIRIEQAFNAMRIIKKVGIESAGFFMLGLPGESVETMEETIRYAIKLNPDYAKATVLVPFPGTRIFDEYEKKGLIKTRDWSRYNFHEPSEIYTHPTLSWDILKKYYELFHKRFYFRPAYLITRFWNSLLSGRLIYDIYSGYRTFFGRK